MIASEHYERVDLKPGELCIADKPTIVWTILGSCVALTLHHKHTNFSAICHAQLPQKTHSGSKCADLCPIKCCAEAKESDLFKFVSCSAIYMLKAFIDKGIPKRSIEAKLFGGANVLASPPGRESVGAQNLKTAMAFIKENGLRLVSQDTGGKKGRTLYFYSDTGEVLLKKH